jgi:hypothetical protein
MTGLVAEHKAFLILFSLQRSSQKYTVNALVGFHHP